MPTRQDDKDGWAGRADRQACDDVARSARARRSCRSASPASCASVPSSAPAAQIPFDQAAADLTSPDAGTRLHAVQLLKEAAYPEAAMPLAALVTDPHDAVQLEAIAAELNIFLAEKIVPRKRVALVVEVAERGAGRGRVFGRTRSRSARARCRSRC